MDNLLARFRDRKLVQWTLGYLAVAWALVQGTELVGAQFGWPLAARSAFTVVAFLGVLPVAVLAWYHGEHGDQSFTPTELGLLGVALAMVVAGGTMAYLRADAAAQRDAAALNTRVLEALAEAENSTKAAEKFPGRDDALWIEAYEKASAVVALAPELVDAQSILCYTARYAWLRNPAQRAGIEPDLRSALSHLQRLAPDDPRTFLCHARIVRDVDGDFSTFLEVADRGLAVNPKDANLRDSVLSGLRDLERWEEVRARLTQYLSVSPEDAGLWRDLGQSEVVLRDWDAARKAFDRALELQTEPNLGLFVDRSQVEIHAGDMAAWQAQVEATRPVFGRTYRWVYQCWHIHMALGEHAEAIALIEPLIPQDWSPELKDDLLGSTYFIAGDRAHAARFMAPVLKTRLATPFTEYAPARRMVALAMLGQAQAMAGLPQDALASLDQAEALLPDEGPWNQGQAQFAPFIAIWFGIADAPERSVALLERVMTHRHPWWSPNSIWLHHESEPLRGYPPFETLLRQHGADTKLGSRPKRSAPH
jgi:tetratricopeptide (TPR) repeat protein